MKLRLDGRVVEIGNEDKVFFPDEGITKGAFVEYHAKIAARMLPYVVGRPLSMKRFPDGIAGKSFFQKEAPEHFPAWIERAAVPKENGTVRHPVIRRPADLVYVAGQACIEPHVWLSTVESLRRPDRMIFDLDPSIDDVAVIREAARAVRDVLEDIGLAAFLMTSGSRGYHVWVPLRAEEDFDAIRRLSRGIARAVVDRDPDAFTVEHRKSKRGDRVLIDYWRNGYAQTTIPPYGVRALAGAPVATPIDWDELGRVEPRTYTIRNVFRRLGRKDDPWRDLGRHARSLVGSRKLLADLAD